MRGDQGGDEQLVARRRQEFVARNWPIIAAIDRLAHADFAAQNFGRAADKLRLMEEFLPTTSGIFLRRASAALRSGETGLLEELAAAAPRLANDQEVFHVVEELVGNGRPDLAEQFLAACEARDSFSPGMLTVGRSRILSGTGRFQDAVALLGPEIESKKPSITVVIFACGGILVRRLGGRVAKATMR